MNNKNVENPAERFFVRETLSQLTGGKKYCQTVRARMNVRERRDSYVHNRPSTCGTTNQDFRDAIRNRKDQW